MARPLRIDVQNGWYHVTSRGIDRLAIFRGDRDREHFLELLSELPERFGVLVHAYVLIPNHFHILIQTPRANASKAMHWVKTGYTIWFNIKHERCGPLFHGRFTAALVDGNGSWALEASKYIHLNPVRVERLGLGKHGKKAEGQGLAGGPTSEQVTERLRVLNGHRWSSYSAYVGYEAVPEWLTCDELWRRVCGRKGDGPREYRRYIETTVRSGGEEPPETWRDKTVLGSKQFFEKVKRYVKGDRREQRAIRSWDKAVGYESVVKAVERLKKEKWGEFANRHGDWGRDVVLWAARKWSGLTLKDLGAKVGGMDYAAVCQAVKRIEDRGRRERAFSAKLQWVRRNLSYIET